MAQIQEHLYHLFPNPDLSYCSEILVHIIKEWLRLEGPSEGHLVQPPLLQQAFEYLQG